MKYHFNMIFYIKKQESKLFSQFNRMLRDAFINFAALNSIDLAYEFFFEKGVQVGQWKLESEIHLIENISFSPFSSRIISILLIFRRNKDYLKLMFNQDFIYLDFVGKVNFRDVKDFIVELIFLLQDNTQQSQEDSKNKDKGG